MKKIHIIALAIFVVVASSAIMAAPSFAASKFLFESMEIGVGGVATEVTLGDLLLEDEGAPGAPAFLCEGIFDILIEETGVLGLVEHLLTIGGELLENGGNDLIECLSEKGECAETTDVETRNLPWHFEVELDLEGTTEAYLLDLLAETGKMPRFVVDCIEPLLGLVEDSCEGLTSARVFTSEEQGTLGHLLMSFNQLALVEKFGALSQLLHCSLDQPGTLQGLVETHEDLESNAGLFTSAMLALSP